MKYYVYYPYKTYNKLYTEFNSEEQANRAALNLGGFVSTSKL